MAANGPTVTVVAKDRPGLLAAVAGVFALHGLDVRSADVTSEGDFAVELFDVEPSRRRWPDWELVADEIDATLRGTLPLDERLASQARAYAGERRPSSPRPVATEVTVMADASAESTVIEIRAADAIGLLYRVTAALFALDLDVVAARVSTVDRRGGRRLLRPGPGQRGEDQPIRSGSGASRPGPGPPSAPTPAGADASSILLSVAGPIYSPNFPLFPSQLTCPVTGRWYHPREELIDQMPDVPRHRRRDSRHTGIIVAIVIVGVSARRRLHRSRRLEGEADQGRRHPGPRQGAPRRDVDRPGARGRRAWPSTRP